MILLPILFSMIVTGGDTVAATLPMRPKPFTVIVDPGHGGSDPGATYHQTREADISLQVGKKVLELLEKDLRFRAVITRKSDKTISLKERAEIAHRENADLFISIHTNASTNSQVHGVEFYFQNQLPPDKEAYFLAGRENDFASTSDPRAPASFSTPLSENKDIAAILDDMQRNKRILDSNQLVKRLYSAWDAQPQKRHLSIRQAPFYLISHVEMPSALVELGYISHKKEVRSLKNSESQDEMAASIFSGIVKFKEMLDKQSR